MEIKQVTNMSLSPLVSHSQSMLEPFEIVYIRNLYLPTSALSPSPSNHHVLLGGSGFLHVQRSAMTFAVPCVLYRHWFPLSTQYEASVRSPQTSYITQALRLRRLLSFPGSISSYPFQTTQLSSSLRFHTAASLNRHKTLLVSSFYVVLIPGASAFLVPFSFNDTTWAGMAGNVTETRWKPCSDGGAWVLRILGPLTGIDWWSVWLPPR